MNIVDSKILSICSKCVPTHFNHIIHFIKYSGQMLASISGDFFGDAELSNLTIEQPLAMDVPGGGGVSGGQGGFGSSLNWEVPR